MGILYVLSALVIIGMSAEHLPGALRLIWTDAFAADSVTGGMVGALIVGFQRALFSNEAGIGSASIAHSAVQTDEPASEGLVSLLEPFIDTMVICSLSSLVIVTTVAFLVMVYTDGYMAHDEGYVLQGVRPAVRPHQNRQTGARQTPRTGD